jgi:hypothetical protein
VDVKDVDVVGAQALEAVLHLPADVFPVEAAGVWPLAGREVHLRGDHVVVAVPVGEPLADPALARPVAVDVGGVDEATARRGVGVQQVVCGLAVGLQAAGSGLAAKAPGAEGDFADL